VRSVSICQRPLGVEHATVVLVLVEIVADDGEEVLVAQVRPAVSRSRHGASAGFRSRGSCNLHSLAEPTGRGTAVLHKPSAQRCTASGAATGAS
jgi:hypothetical protein